MPLPPEIVLGDGTRMAILRCDRSVLALDKPAGWMLAPTDWDRTSRNLQRALESSLRSGASWAKVRRISFLRYVHRLDADTSGVVVFARHKGALRELSRLFASRQIQKQYLAVVHGVPDQEEWTCRVALAPSSRHSKRVVANEKTGQWAETRFQVLQSHGDVSLVKAEPVTGRTHQIRVHLAISGCPVVHDPLYGRGQAERGRLALRATMIGYKDPFTRKPIRITAPAEPLLATYGFSPAKPRY